MMPQPSATPRVERVIAAARVALAAASLVALWLEPVEPVRFASISRWLHEGYVVYAVVVAILAWRRERWRRLGVVSHVADIAVATAFQYLAVGPSSPFLIYFVFALFAAAVRWSWRETLLTAGIVLAAFLAVSGVLVRPIGPLAFEWNRFVIRVAYLLVVATLLVTLGRHEARRREEIRGLARWPLVAADEVAEAVPRTLEHAAGILGAGSALVVWSTHDEPWSYRATWPVSQSPGGRYPPASWEPPVPDALADACFVSEDRVGGDTRLIVSRGGSITHWAGVPVHHALGSDLAGRGLASAPFATDRVAGRVFFTGLAAGDECLPIVEVVGREIGLSIDRLHSYEASRQLAIAEDRIRVARDLHDGVLQALTGIRLRLQTMALGERERSTSSTGDALLAIERALALEQRELRRFIDELKPAAGPPATGTLADRLEGLRGRLVSEWHTPVTVRVSPPELILPSALNDHVSLMVHEAIANALKHARPSRVSAELRLEADALCIAVSDDGCGFAFRGKHEHEALVAANTGPASLRDRVASLGGRMTLESGPSGSRVELVVPLGVAHA